MDKGHGRREKRALTTTTWLAGYLAPDWPGCAQVFRIERERRIGSRVESEVSYGITSLTREQAGAERLLALARAHWGVENRLHHRRDVSLGEDASRIRRGAAAQVMAALRNLVLFLAPRSGHESLPASQRHFHCHVHKAVALLTSRR
ncbi:MAG: ISAs1 family transposase [Isosphaeraceae bacterium]